MQPIMQVKNGHFNMRNPACYVFHDENSCSTGDHFRADQKDDMLNFISYKGYEFSMPKTQHISNWISFITILICGGFLVVTGLQALLASYRRKTQLCRLNLSGRFSFPFPNEISVVLFPRVKIFPKKSKPRNKNASENSWLYK